MLMRVDGGMGGMSEGLAIDFAEVISDHIIWVGALLILIKLL
jgi:hypothetical protein